MRIQVEYAEGTLTASESASILVQVVTVTFRHHLSKVVGLTRDVAESYAPVTITVSYAGQSGTPKPFLVIINWIKVGKDWKVAAEIILPVPAQ